MSVAMLTQASAAYELSCAAPQTFVGDTFDNNPVTGITVRYSPEEHAWRVFHRLLDGSIVSRSEQYAIVDRTDTTKVQWAGSLNRQRNLYMIGEVKRVDGKILY